ncbi:MAG: hypothetical protein J6Q82_06590 [Clostridia bacterium]|nr:hypothetical protein [Clostridia bacterium]
MKTKWLYLMMLVGGGGIFVLLSFGLTLAYLACNNDIILFQSALPELLDVLRDLSEIFAWAIALSILAYAIFFRTAKNIVFRLILLLCGLLLLRRLFDLLAILIMYQTLSLYNDLFFNIFYWIVDLLLLLISMVLASSTAKKYYRQCTVKNKAKTLFGNDVKVDLSTEDFYPFQTFFTKKNPLQRCLLKISILFSVSKVLSRLIFDLGYGAPEDVTEALIMCLYYLSDLIFGAVFYIFCILIFHVIFAKLKKQKNLDDVN